MKSQDVRDTPYPGLRPFEANEAHLFFGRDEQSDELLRRLRVHRFLALVGTSGSGKSSLVRAGLLPGLLGGFMVKAGAAWRIAIMRPGADPIGNLARALNAPDVFGVDDSPHESKLSPDLFTEVTLRRGPLGLIEATRHAGLAGDENLLVLVDQFEELFRFAKLAAPGREDDPAAFVNLLLEAARHDDAAIYVVITMRSEFLGECTRFRGLAETINEGQYLVPRLTRDQLRDAIVGPAKVEGAEVSAPLVQRLLADAGDDPGQLPVLQHALMRTWDLWRAAGENIGPLDLLFYIATGGMSEALSRHADDVYQELPDERSREIAKKLFQRLTERRDGISIRRPTPLGEICEIVGADEDEVIRVVDAFRRVDRSFLMPTQGSLNRESTLDISHESLINVWNRLKGWTEDEQRSAEQYRRLCEAAELHEAGRGSLWRRPELDIGVEWREKNRPTAAWAARYNALFTTAMRFLDESEKQRQADAAKQRREKFTLRLGLTVVTAVIAAFAAVGLYQATAAQQARSDALQSRIRSVRAVRDPLARALLLAELGNSARPEHLGLYQEAAAAAIPLAVLRYSPDESVIGAGFIGDDKIAVVSAGGTLLSWRSDGSGPSSGLSISEHDDAAPDRVAATSPARLTAASFSRDGRWIAGGLSSGAVWVGRSDGSTGLISNRSADAGVPTSHLTVTALAFSRDGRQIAAGYSDYTARIWRQDQMSEGVLNTVPTELARGHEGPISSIDFDSTGRRVATGSWDGTTRIWNLDHPATSAIRLGGGDGSVTSVAFSPDGAWVLCGYDKGIARIWSSSGERTNESTALPGPAASVTSVAFSPDGSKVVTASTDSTARVWIVRGVTESDGKSQRKTLRIVGSPTVLTHDSKVIAVAFSQDGKKIVTASDDGLARVWWSQPGEPRILGMHDGRVESVAFSRDASRVLSASDDNSARVWAIDGRSNPLILTGHSNWVRSAGFSPTDSQKVVTASDDGTLRLWNLALPGKSRVSQERDRVFGAAFVRDGGRLVTAVADNTARVWNASSLDLGGRPLDGPDQSRPVELRHDDWVLSAAFSPDGSEIVTASRDGIARIWAAARNAQKPVKEFVHPGGTVVYDAAFSPDGSKIVTASADGRARIWSVEGSDEPTALLHTGDVYKAAFSSDGNRIVTASKDGTATIWNAANGSEQVVLQHGTEAVRAASFNPADSEVVTGTTDGIVRVWRVTLDALVKYLREASTACVTPTTRSQYLGESAEQALSQYQACERRYGRIPTRK